MVDPSEPALPGRGASGLRERPTAPEPIAPEPPWRRSKQRPAFAGDISAFELPHRLALAPDRVPEPPSPISRPPALTWARRLIGLVVLAALGFIGYRLSSAPPTDVTEHQFLPPSDRADSAPEQSVSANLKGSGLRSKSPTVRPTLNAVPSGSPSEQPISFPSPESGRPFEIRSRATKVDVPSSPESAESGTSPFAEPAPAIVRDDRERALKLKQKGDEQLTQGLIAPARLLYERAADLGLAQAALALAATYDEAALARSNLRGVSPDPQAAAHWYERARLLAARDPDRQVPSLGRN